MLKHHGTSLQKATKYRGHFGLRATSAWIASQAPPINSPLTFSLGSPANISARCEGMYVQRAQTKTILFTYGYSQANLNFRHD
jgi:hypothetical protein